MHFFDKVEDGIRFFLSRKPMLFALISGTGIVLFWRGIWEISYEIGLSALWSLLIGIIILLATGTFVSFFIGEQIIISGLKKEKRLEEKTEEEILREDIKLSHIDMELESLKKQVRELEKRI